MCNDSVALSAAREGGVAETAGEFRGATASSVDLPYITGHLRSAMSESSLPEDRQEDFAGRLSEALAPSLDRGALSERIDATALIGICSRSR